MSSIFNYGSGHLTISTVISIASGKIKGVLSEAVIKQVNDSQKAVQQIVDEGRTVYGVNTGFGILANTCLLYTSPSPRDRTRSRMPSSA